MTPAPARVDQRIHVFSSNNTMTQHPRRWAILALGIGLLTTAPLAAEEVGPEGGGPAAFKALKYRNIGPSAGGRVSRVAGVPGDPLTYYAAAAASGVWKSSDGGQSWKPIFDDQPVSSVGSIAVAPSDPNVVYVGSGEANIRGNVAAGNGIYKSTDAGKTWKHVWKNLGQIGTLIVHPHNPDVAFAAVLGSPFGPGNERGVYRTADGGKTWQRVLFKDRDTGASDVCFDPSNPRVLFAGLWQARRKPWEMTSGGPGSGLYVSRDGGDTWTQLGGHGVAKEKLKGLPEGIYGKVGVAVAPSDPRRVYALIEADQGGLYRSDDGGDSWKRASEDKKIRQRAFYYMTLTVDPKNADVVWFPQVSLHKTIDGGKTILTVRGPHHGDHHDLWIDPANPKRLISANDGGVDISTNGGENWFAPLLPISQFYHISVDSRVPYHVFGNMQDLGTASGPSNSLSAGGIGIGDWSNVGGGETGFTVADPSDPNVVYSGEYGGYLSVHDRRTGATRNISAYPYNPSGHDPANLKYRFQWTAPILVSRHDPKTVYHAANVLFRTEDRGQTWKAVSPDLTRNDRGKQKWSGGPITGDNTGVEIYGTIFALAESPKQQGVLWAGTDDGLVHVSRDGGRSWVNVTANIPDLPEWGTVVCVEASPFDAGTAYVVVDNHRLDDYRPYLFKTADFGKSWKNLTTNLPQDVYLHVVRADPKKKGLLYLGTERGVAFSPDDGATWQPLKLNLPTVAVHDLVVKDDDLVVGTNGRSIWILDDLTPIRAWSPAVADKALHLFEAQPATRWLYRAPVYSTQDRNAGPNPPYGLVVHYYLKSKPRGDVTLEILGADGKPIRKLSSKEDPADKDDKDDEDEDDEKKLLGTDPGVQRAVWDLRHKGADKIKKAQIDLGDPKDGPLALPGEYTARLTVDGKSLTTRVTVLPDPRPRVERKDLDESLALTLQLRAEINRLTGLVNRLRTVRKQLQDRGELLKDEPRAKALVTMGKDLVTRLDALEEKLHNPRAKISYDILAQKGGAKLYSQLVILYEFVKDTDAVPGQGLREVFADQAKELARLEAEFNKLVAGELAKLNEAARKLDVPNVIVPAEPVAAPK